MNPGKHVAVPNNKVWAEKLGLGRTPLGGLAPGTRVMKVNSENGDVNPDGTVGIVKGGVVADLTVEGKYVAYLYLVEFEGMPKGTLNGTCDIKLKEA
jgi:hypothetical protein